MAEEGAGVWSGDRNTPRGELLERAARATRALASLGVGRGDSVALLLRNDVAFFEASYAAAALGAYAVPVNWHFREDEVRHVVSDSGARAVVAHADLLAAVRHTIPDGVEVVAVRTPPEIAQAYGLSEGERETPAGVRDWDTWTRSHEPWDRKREASPASMIYTSGTTGNPKGVRRRPFGREHAATVQVTTGHVLGVEPGVRTVVCGPLYHSAPNAHGLAAVLLGGHVVLMPRFDPAELLRLVEAHQITNLLMVPTMFVRLLALPEDVRRAHDVSSLRHVVHAAAPCPPAVKRAMIEWWGPVVHEFYGGTESGPVTFCSSEEALARPGTVGRAVEGADVRILDEAGSPVPAGTVGEVFMGLSDYPDFTYHGQAERRSEIEVAGLITCGDLGYLDEDGYLFLCDRKRDMVISGGVNIYPAEIEAVLHGLAGVRDVAVFGIPDSEFGEVLAAVVEPAPGASLTPDAVRDHVRAHLAAYKVPRHVEFRDALPREDSGKIFKRKLRAPFWESEGRTI
ncbi:MAG: AMP-binding protein [Acidimicrobiia bacterium]|nr:AMP-binding protein [Acidimicrobiia bacterium]